ncbi:DUF1295 domain-containing protein [archaeon]|nr:MAG: DUF1295 domain-containing protein [archaeon]
MTSYSSSKLALFLLHFLIALCSFLSILFRLEDTDGRWCDVGLWRYSRHPNYFGELLFWWGIFTSCSFCFSEFYFLTTLGPLFVTWLLLGLSGMPLLEKQANERFRAYQGYQEYRQETSPLVPLPRNFYASLPLVVKRTLLFEWTMYEEGLKVNDLTYLSSLNTAARI